MKLGITYTFTDSYNFINSFISLISLSIMGTIEYYIALMLGGKKA